MKPAGLQPEAAAPVSTNPLLLLVKVSWLESPYLELQIS